MAVSTMRYSAQLTPAAGGVSIPARASSQRPCARRAVSALPVTGAVHMCTRSSRWRHGGEATRVGVVAAASPNERQGTPATTQAAPVTPSSGSADVFTDPVEGSRRFSNYFWASVVTGGAGGFLATGVSSKLGYSVLPFLDASGITFFPQGLVMSFYGVAGLTLSLYLWLTIAWDVGSGYNEFNKANNTARIFRFGFPGKNRRINLTSPLADVRAVRVEVKDGLNPRRVLYLCVKGRGDIPLTAIGQPMPLEELEGRAAKLARFLQVPIEGL